MLPTPSFTWKNLRRWGSDAPNIILSNFGVESAPVDIESICLLLGIEINYGKLGGQYVSVGRFRSGNPIVVLDDRFPEVQQRVSIAVQIGLVSLGQFDGSTGAYEYSDYYKRVPSYEFAGNILMPSWLIDEYDYGLSVSSYARRFKVPADLARARIIDYYSPPTTRYR